MPVDAIMAAGVGGPEWNIALPETSGSGAIGGAGDSAGIDGIAGVDGTSPSGDKGFAGMLGKQIDNLQSLQTDAATQSQALATGQAEDASQVVMAVEKARLSMQLAASLRDKSVESFQEIFRTQV